MIVRCYVTAREPLDWEGRVTPAGMSVDLAEGAAAFLASHGLVRLSPQLAPRPPRPEPRPRQPFAWALADIEAAAAAAPKPAARAFWQGDEPRQQKRAQARPARQRPRQGGGASLPRWTATDAPRGR